MKYGQGYDLDREMIYYDEIALDDDPNGISEYVIEPGMASATYPLATTTYDMNTVAVVKILEEHAGKLNIPEIKYELNKGGKGMGGNKKILFDLLIKCIRDKTQVGEKIAEIPGCMNGLDIPACWVPLTRNSFPILDTVNADANLLPPTEREAPINPR